WPDDGVRQDVALRSHLVSGNHWPLGIAKQSRVHPREMAEVGEVLDLAGSVTLPAVRSGPDSCPRAVFQFRDIGERPPGLGQSYPDQAVALLRHIGRNPGLGRHPRRVLKLWYGNAAAIGGIPPPMVRTDQLVTADPAQRERSTPVHAKVRHSPEPTRPAPHDQR